MGVVGAAAEEEEVVGPINNLPVVVVAVVVSRAQRIRLFSHLSPSSRSKKVSSPSAGCEALLAF